MEKQGNNLRLQIRPGCAKRELRDEQLLIQIPALEIFVPGLGLLSEQNPLADRPISLGARRAFSFSKLHFSVSLI